MILDSETGELRATLDDYLTTELPDETWQRWPFTYAFGMAGIQSTYPWWTRANFGFEANTGVSAPFGKDEPWINECYGWYFGGSSSIRWRGSNDWNASGIFYYPQNAEPAIAALKNYATARIKLAFPDYTPVWTDNSWTWGPAAYSSGPESDMHYLDANGQDAYTAILGDYRKSGTSVWHYDPKVDIPTSVAGVRAALTQGIANSGWRMVKPQMTKPTVHPLAGMTNGRQNVPPSGASAVITHIDTGANVMRLVSLNGMWFPRTDGKPAWVKLLHETNLQSPVDNTKAWHPTIISNTAVWAPDGLHTTCPEIRCLPSGATLYCHFATVDGAQSPSTNNEANTLIGVDEASGSWQTLGVPGLRAHGNFKWYGRYASYPTQPTWANKPLRLTVVMVPSGVSVGAPANLTQLLAVPGVVTAAQWELWPESAVGPVLPTTAVPTALDIRADSCTSVKIKATKLISIDGGTP